MLVIQLFGAIIYRFPIVYFQNAESNLQGGLITFLVIRILAVFLIIAVIRNLDHFLVIS